MIISKKPPYASTKADPERTKLQINKLLQGYGILRYNWAEDYESQQVTLTFETETKDGKKFLIRVTPPTFAMQRRTYDALKGHYIKQDLPNWAQSYRMLYHWLKAKIEAVAYNLTAVEQEFLAQVYVPSRNATLGEIFTADKLSQLALEEKPIETAEKEWDREQSTEATYTEVSE